MEGRRDFTERDIEQRAYGLWQADGGRCDEAHYWHLAREELERERDNGTLRHGSGAPFPEE